MKNIFSKKYNTVYILNIALLISISSCKKFVQIEPAPDLIKTEMVFKNDQTALSAVMEVYIQMRISGTRFTDAGMSIFGALSADEIYNTSSNATWDPFFNNTIL